MKKKLLTIFISIASYQAHAQSNIYEVGGNVGIGTPSPLSKLQINSGVGLGPLKAVGPGGYLLIDNVGSGHSYYQSDIAHHFQGANGVETLTILNSGNVGVGVTSPVSKLDISGSLHTNSSSALAAMASNGAYFGWNKSGGGGETNFINNIGGGNIGGFTFDKTANGSTFTRLLTIAESGNVGIGISNPTSTLTVNGNLSISNGQNKFTYNGAADINLQYSERGSGGRALVHDSGNKLTLNYGGDFTGGTGIGTNVYFAANSSGTSYISNGSLAIGTSDAKGYKLAVAGNVVAEQITVKLQSSWPDYVFDRYYNLRSLKDLEQYLNANRHLPDIPSATEIHEKGQDLGKINSALVKNVEELTLHLIEKDKQIELQQRIIEVQNRRITKIENEMHEMWDKIKH